MISLKMHIILSPLQIHIYRILNGSLKCTLWCYHLVSNGCCQTNSKKLLCLSGSTMYRNLNELLNVNDIFYFRSHKNYKDRK